MPSNVKNYLWLNPIVEKMIEKDRDSVILLLTAKGYTVVQCTSGAAKTYEAYVKYIKGVKVKPVIDARCPLVASLIKQKYPSLAAHLAPIAPILSACTEDLYNKYVEPFPEKASLTVIAPCTALADDGQARFGSRVRFVTWKQFSKEIDDLLMYPPLSISPVPPGFFRDFGEMVLESSGARGIDNLLEAACQGKLSPSVYLLEMLYCENGCHKGDGVTVA